MRPRTQISMSSSGLLAFLAAAILAPGQAFSASPETEAAIKALAGMPADAEKFQSYCNLLGEMENVSETDSAKSEELEGRLEDLMESYGSDVMRAWELASNTDPDSEDGKALNAAFEEMEAKCP